MKRLGIVLGLVAALAVGAVGIVHFSASQALDPEEVGDRIFHAGYAFELVQAYDQDEFELTEHQEDFELAGSVAHRRATLEEAQDVTDDFSATVLPLGCELYAREGDELPEPVLEDGQEDRYLVFDGDQVLEYRVVERYAGEQGHEGYAYAYATQR